MSRFVDRALTDEAVLENGDRVRIRRQLAASEENMLMARLVHIELDTRTGEAKPVTVDWGRQKIESVKAHLVGWDFKNEDGQPVAFNPELVEELDSETINEIAKAIDRLQAERREDGRKKGGKRSGR